MRAALLGMKGADHFHRRGNHLLRLLGRGALRHALAQRRGALWPSTTSTSRWAGHGCWARAILSVGALMKKAVVDERERVVASDRMTLTLVCDHRILYGADGAEFLARVRELLQSPLSLAL